MKKALPLFVIASMVLALIPSAFATLGPLTVTAGPYVKGTTVKVTQIAGAVPAGTVVQLYWDTTTGAWDGTKGLLNSTTAKASGAYEVWFNVPESTGGTHYVWAKDASGNTVSAIITVTPTIKFSTSSGLPGDAVTATLYGFGGSKSAGLVWYNTLGYNVVYYNGVVHPDYQLGTGDGTTKEFTGTIAHKYFKEGTWVMGVNHSPVFGNGTALPIAGGKINTGTNGTINMVTGAYDVIFGTTPGNTFPVGSDYLYVDLGSSTFDLGSGNTNSLGTLALSIKVPAVAATTHTYSIMAEDATGTTLTKTFNVGPVISLQPVSGAVGDVIHVTGRGWTPGHTITTFTLSRPGFTSACKNATGALVDLNGRFRTDIIVPGAPKVIDDYSITATDGVGTAKADFEVTALQAISVNPLYGPQGTSITVSGTNWSKVVDTVVTIDLVQTDGVTPVTNIGTAKTISDGTFSKAFTVPAQVEGPYKIKASIGTYTSKTTGFRIGTMGIQLSSSSGPTGKAISISGNGFTTSGTWNATIGTKTLKSNGAVSAAGLLQGGSVYIPKGLAPGVYTISVLDITADITLTAQFTVTAATSITVNPNAAPNGYNVSINGLGFKYASAGITFTLYNKTSTGAADYIWSMNVLQKHDVVGTAVVNGTGIVRAYWVVPAAATIGGGNYYINATDADSYLAQATFQVLAKHVVITPRKATFGVGDTISFQIEHTTAQTTSYLKIYDPNNVLVFLSDNLATWVKTGLWYTATYSSQTSAGNPMVLPSDAPIGTWTYKWYDGADKLITNGTFAVAAAAPSAVQQQITDLSKQLTDLKAQITGITTQITSIQTAATAAQNTATAAQTSAAAAKTSADAATTAATAAGTAANAAVTAANAAKTSADNAAAGTSGLTTLVYAAIGASLVAALAAIVALMQISRKIA